MIADLPPDDASLIRLVQTGTPAETEEAFRQLVLRHSSHLFLHLSRMGLALEEQEDIASETWLRVSQMISKFQDRGLDLFPWLQRISDYVSREHSRSKLARESRERLGSATDAASDNFTLSIPDQRLPTYEMLSRQEFKEVVQHILDDAPVDYREVLNARFFLEFKPDEIMALYNWSRSKVDITYYRAIRWLKEKFLERYGPQDWTG